MFDRKNKYLKTIIYCTRPVRHDSGKLKITKQNQTNMNKLWTKKYKENIYKLLDRLSFIWYNMYVNERSIYKYINKRIYTTNNIIRREENEN